MRPALEISSRRAASSRSPARTSCGSGGPPRPIETTTGSTPRSRSSVARCPATAVLPVRLPVPITRQHRDAGLDPLAGGGERRRPGATYSSPRSSATAASASRLSIVSTGSPERSKTASASHRRQLGRPREPRRAHSDAAGRPTRRRATFSSPPTNSTPAISCSVARRSSASRTTAGWCSPSMSAITLIGVELRGSGDRAQAVLLVLVRLARELDDRLAAPRTGTCDRSAPAPARSRSCCSRAACGRAGAASRPCRR